jgi:hypothetical protein
MADEPNEKLARMAEADMAQVANVARMTDRILSAFEPKPSNVVSIAPKVDDDDRRYMAEQFDEIVDLIERLPRTYRVFMGRDMSVRDRASLVEIAGLLAAMGARVAPQPKDAA